MIFAYALTEPMVGSDAQHIRTKATLSADGSYYTLTGQKTYITNGGYAGGFTVFAQMDESKPGYMGAFIVERRSEGVRVGPNMRKMGLKASSTTMVGLNEVKVPAENLLGKPGEGFKIAMTILNYGRLGLGAGSVAAMEQSLSDMLARSTSRVQFGAPIVSFELIREKLARAKAHGFAASCLTYFTAKLLEAYPLLNVAEESSHCKLYSTTRAWDSLYDALQTAGGAGYLATHPYEKRMRDARVTTVFEGTTEIHSIYPALFLARDLGKALKKAGPIGKLALMAGGSMGGPRARALAKVASLKEGALREGLAFAAGESASYAKEHAEGPREIRRGDLEPRIPAPAPDFAQPGRLRTAILRRADRAAKPCRAGRRRLPRALLLPPRGGAGEREGEPSLRGLRGRGILRRIAQRLSP